MPWINSPVLFGLDWGSTQVRAFAFGPTGEVLEQRAAALGVSLHPGPSGVAAVLDWLSDWLSVWPQVPIIACGMVGSPSGWRQAGYVETPATAVGLADGLLQWEEFGRTVAIVPGVSHWRSSDGFNDVMRGEETQLIGLMQQEKRLSDIDLLMTPGTHNKWVLLQEETIASLSTYMTGEMFALLRQHSLIGAVLADGPWDEKAFCEGVAAAGQRPDWLHQLFGVRARGVQKRLPPEVLTHWLSGLLIGYEIHAGLASLAGIRIRKVGLVGGEALCNRYRLALGTVDIEAEWIDGDLTVTAGLWHLARLRGLA